MNLKFLKPMIPIIMVMITIVAFSAPAKPQRLTVLQTSTGPAVVLAWDQNDPGDQVTGYNVYRAPNSGDYDKGTAVRLAQAPAAAPTYTDNTVQRGKTYWYVVTAVNATAESARSNELKADIPLLKPAAPKNLRIVQIVAYIWDGFRAVASVFVNLGRGAFGVK